MSDIASIESGLELFRKDNGRYPSTAEGLGVLVTRPDNGDGWNGPYVMRVRDDPWGHPYVYRLMEDGSGYILYSRGRDGIGGTSDDIPVEH